MCFRLVTSVGQRKKILSPHEESDLRSSDSALRCSTTEPQRLHGKRGLLRSSYETRPAYCWDRQCRKRQARAFPITLDLTENTNRIVQNIIKFCS